LDKYYYLAKEKGYRSRAAFKLVQLNKKYGFLQKSKCLIDLCAAPGGWLQVAAETMPIKSLIVGVDLAPIKPVPKTITFQGDITTDKTRAILRGHLKTWKADTVIHDGAPNVGTAWVQDAFSQNELVLHSLRLACDFLGPNGTFVTKVFRSKDSAKLEWCFKQLFDKVEQTKPPSSRNVSAETFYVCRGYKAPKNLDPRFLDPQYAFAEVKDAVPNNEAKVFNPEVKKRKREGYDEGDWTQYHEVPVSDFIQTTDPIAILGGMNKLTFNQDGNGDIALATIDKLPETTEDVRICCADLKVLGKKEFRLLLKWRLQVRARFGFATKSTDHVKKTDAEKAKDAENADDEEAAEVESMDEEMKLQEELQNMKDNLSKDKKKARRKDNEKKQKEVMRLQMNMTTPMEIGMEQAGPNGEDAMFQLKAVDKAGLTGKLQKGKMQVLPVTEKKDDEFDMEFTDDELGDGLEGELDIMYNAYQEKREARDGKVRAKKARKQRNEDGEFEGFSNDEEADSDDDAPPVEYDSDSDDDDDEKPAQLITDLDNTAAPANGLTRRAANFFDQDLFKGIDGLDGLDDGEEEEEQQIRDLDSGIEMDSSSASPPLKAEKVEKSVKVKKAEKTKAKSKVLTPSQLAEEEKDYETDSSDGGFEMVKNTQSQWDKDSDAIPLKNGRPNIDIITAEAMTLAHQLATGQVTKSNLLDDNFNKYSLRDVDGLPEWFLDDEGKNSKPHRPITKEAANAIKEKMRAFNARPIKKVREAKARKQLHAAQKLEKLKRKSALLAESEDVSEKDKGNQISRIMARAGKTKKRKPVQVVVAGRGVRGKGRPGGVKGKYKMVDARLKKDVRAEKRLKKKIAGKK
jgi:AdoMet-dependent rRNA methyltransferase SPB1